MNSSSLGLRILLNKESEIYPQHRIRLVNLPSLSSVLFVSMLIPACVDQTHWIDNPNYLGQMGTSQSDSIFISYCLLNIFKSSELYTFGSLYLLMVVHLEVVVMFLDVRNLQIYLEIYSLNFQLNQLIFLIVFLHYQLL